MSLPPWLPSDHHAVFVAATVASAFATTVWPWASAGARGHATVVAVVVAATTSMIISGSLHDFRRAYLLQVVPLVFVVLPSLSVLLALLLSREWMRKDQVIHLGCAASLLIPYTYGGIYAFVMGESRYCIGFWILFLGALLMTTGCVLGLLRPVPRTPSACEKCGYDLTGNLSGVCPECGRPTCSAESSSSVAG
jgi:hypothetical protein